MKLIKFDQEIIVNCLKQGQVVAMPSDTVFGLFATIKGKDDLFVIKNRVQSKPIAVMFSSYEQVLDYIDEQDTTLLKSTLPGKFTYLCKTNKAGEEYGHEGYIGIRVPDSKRLRDVIELVGPLFATSANKSGDEVLTSSSEVMDHLDNDLIKLVVEGNALESNPSTIIKLETKEKVR